MLGFSVVAERWAVPAVVVLLVSSECFFTEELPPVKFF
jgi:hypothetical protein